MNPPERAVIAMASSSAVGSMPRSRIERRKAANVTCELAAMRRVTVRKVGKDNRPGPALYSKTDMLIAAESGASFARGMPPAARGQWAGAKRSTIAFDAGRRPRTVTEIEHAFFALQRAEPAPEAWPHELVLTAEPSKAQSIWPLIGGIWVSTIAVAGGALAAMVYLLG
jgi:hypothetical protein